MKLWVDGQALQSASAFRGIGRYVIELLKAIVNDYPDVDLHISFNAAMPDELMSARFLVEGWIRSDHIHIWHGVAKAGEIVEGFSVERQFSEIMLAHHVAAISPDIAFSVSPFEGGHDLCVPLIDKYGHDFLMASIFYDAIPIRFQERYLPNEDSLNYYMRRLRAYKNFDLCLSISDFANTELNDLMRVQRSVPIFAGLSSAFDEALFSEDVVVQKNRVIDEPYMLYVGGLDWRKNVELVIQAYSMSGKIINSGLNFVIAGDTYEPEEAAFKENWANANLKEDRLKIIGRVSDQSLVNLYSHAEFSVLPSFMEGFGLTVLESVACGTPVLASEAGALSEILGGDSSLFSPNKANQLSALMEQMLDVQFKEELIESSSERLRQYTWKNTASLTIDSFISLRSETKVSSVSAEDRVERTALAAQKLSLPDSFMAKGLSLTAPMQPEEGRILFDTTSTTNHDHGTGIQRVVKSVVKNVLQNEEYGSKSQLIFCDNKGPFSRVGLNSKGQFSKLKNSSDQLIQFHSNDVIIMLDSSWEFHTYHKKYLLSPKLNGAQIYSILYDMVPLRTSAFCDEGMSGIFASWLTDALQYSDGFICISKAIADEFHDLLKAIKFPRPIKIGYWHLGANFHQVNKSGKTDQKDSYKDQEKNYLMVGTLEPRKGYKVAIDAFTALWKKGHKEKLTIVGKKGWGVKALIDTLKNHAEYNKKLFWFDNVDDEKLAALYTQSDVLIAASFAEGFGLPIIEAANLNIPIIASDIPVFREVSEGQNVTFFNCGSSESLSDVIENYDLYKKKNRKAKQRVAPKVLTWEESTNNLLAVIEGRNWYIEYSPTGRPNFKNNYIGHLGSLDIVESSNRVFDLEIIEEPYLSDDGVSMKCIVKLVNKSSHCWLSSGKGDEYDKGVSLGARYLYNNQLIDDGIRTRFPLTVIPQTPYYFAVNIPKDSFLSGKQYTIELLQEGVNWWGNGVDVLKRG